VSTDQWLNISSPLMDGGGFDRCNIFDVDFASMNEFTRPSEETATVECLSWEYDESLLQVRPMLMHLIYI
jgi:hypothetical protein